MIEKFRKKLPIDKIQEGPLETGQMNGMSLNEVLETYLDKRNKILTILRVYAEKNIAEVASEIGISEYELKKMENSDDIVPFQLVPKLAKIFNVDLKLLMTVTGHIQESNQVTKDDKSFEIKLAAQYSGPDLTRQEKIDLEELFKIILMRAKTKTRRG